MLVAMGDGCVAWGMGRLDRGRFLAEAWDPFTEPELETNAGPELRADAELEMGTNAELLGPNAFCAAVRCTFINGLTAFANIAESCCGSSAFCCATCLSVRINSSLTDSAHVVVEVVGVVCVVVKLTIALPAGVGILRAEVTWVGFISVSFAMRSIHGAFSTVTCCA